jgi:GNAT superfamily N-acetyltransferase
MDGFEVVRETEPNPADVEYIRERLLAYNVGHAGEPEKSDVTLFLRDSTGRIAGGLVGHIIWRWLSVDKLWVEESARGSGAGTQLLTMAEEHARAQGCTDCILGTFSFQARPFYEKLGYTICGRIEGFPPSHAMYLLRKSLLAESQSG